MADKSQKITASLTGDVVLCADLNGAEVKIGGGAPRATDLLLMSVAGCSGATLNALLKRDGFNPTKMEMVVEGLRSETRPTRFTDISVNYDIVCENLTPCKLDEYLRLTEQLCPVVQSLNAKMQLTYTLNA